MRSSAAPRPQAWTSFSPLRSRTTRPATPPATTWGETSSQFWRDHQSSKINAIRTRTLIEKSDFVVVRFGDKYKQWNAAFDAGYCAALGKP